MKQKSIGPLLVLSAAIVMSVGGLLIKIIPWNPIAINSGRNLFAALVTFGYLKAIGHKIKWNPAVFLCAVCMAGCCITYTIAARLTTAANAIVLQYTSPVFILLYLWIWFSQKPKRLDLLACAVVFAGMLCCFAGGLSGGKMVGNLLALAAGALYAVVFMVNMFPDADSFSSYFWGQVISFVVGLPWLIREPNFSTVSWWGIVFMGVIQVGLAYLLMARGLADTKPVAANLICMTEPVLNPIWVAIFYGEIIEPIGLLGIGIVLVGLMVYNIANAKRTT